MREPLKPRAIVRECINTRKGGRVKRTRVCILIPAAAAARNSLFGFIGDRVKCGRERS